MVILRTATEFDVDTRMHSFTTPLTHIIVGLTLKKKKNIIVGYGRLES